MRRVLDAAAHTAVWAGMYIAAAVVCLSQTAGIRAQGGMWHETWIRAIAFSFCIAAAVYLLDRVKVRDSWLDPADAAAHPARYDFLAGRTGLLRVVMAVLLALSVWLGLPLFGGSVLFAAGLPALAVVGVLLYAARPRGERDRPKDVLMLKNAYVAGGITGFAAIVAVVAVAPISVKSGAGDAIGLVQGMMIPLTVACVHLFVRVLADAVLCDLDDAVSDAAHGTRTLPGWLGRTNAWNVAMGVRLAISLALAAAAVMLKDVPSTAMLCWAGVTVASSLVLRLWAPAKLRDWVDARFAIEAAVVSLLIYVFASQG